MLNELFNRESQDKMTEYFLKELAPKGTMQTYGKNKIIDPKESNCIYIVIDGTIAQELISEDGKQISLFMLLPGTIFGEMDYFEGSRTCSISHVLTDKAVISILSKGIIERELSLNRHLYNFFMHSIIRKFRILMLKIVDNHSNDFRGKLASTLIRFAIMEEGEICNGARITTIQSITSFSSYLMCSRSTLSTTLSEFREKGIIESDKGDFIIKDKDKLMKYINVVW